MTSNPLRKLLVGLGICFALPWLILVVLPYLSASKVGAFAYAEGDHPEDGQKVYPDPVSQRYGSSDYGRQVYAAEGCAYCHTQVIRPTYAGPDMWIPGWAGREGGKENFARETQPEDYVTEPVALLGYQRIGPDLSNVGHRITDREEMHRHLREPRSLELEGGMPSFRHLYRRSLTGEGVEPTSRADALVDYLLSLKKDQPLPAAYLSRN